MRQVIRKYGALFLVLIVITGVCLLFSGRKSGMFIDEIYTYGLSNSHYAPYLRDVAGGTLRDQTLSRQELLDYVTVDNGEVLDVGSVYYNQTRDVHPPLYYWLFNAVSSLTPELFSKWTGLALDYLIYLWALLALYRLVTTLYGSRFNAAATVALYGLSTLGLSTMLMIRMYVLMTSLTVELALLIARLLREPKAKDYPLAGLVIFLGLMTQYYFVFYAFFLCGFFVLRQLFRREFRSAALFSVCAFAGVGLLLLCFPACLDHLFAEALVSGGNAVENLLDLSQYPFRLGYIYSRLRHGLHAVILLVLLLLPALLFCLKKLRAAGADGRLHWDGLLILLPAVLCLPLIAVISPVSDERYLYSLIPILITGVSLLLHLLEESLGGRDRYEGIKTAALLLILALALWEARTVPPEYLYPEYREYDAIVAEHAADPCLYMTDDYFAPVTQDLQQLLAFDDLFLTGDADSTALDDYLAERDSGSCVVFIDTSAYWSSGFDPERTITDLLASTEYTEADPLYENGLSVVYLLTK